MQLKETDKAKTKVTCYIALGSNMGDSLAYIHRAIKDLESHSQIQDLEVSKFYKSKPHGPQDQPDYLNAAVVLKTDLEAEALLDVLQTIENNNDRVREGTVRWGARTLDLDLLYYANDTINTTRLMVPHPRICERAFVLFPLCDLLTADEITNLKINETLSILDCIDALPKEELINTKEFDHVK